MVNFSIFVMYIVDYNVVGFFLDFVKSEERIGFTMAFDFFLLFLPLPSMNNYSHVNLAQLLIFKCLFQKYFWIWRYAG